MRWPWPLPRPSPSRQSLTLAMECCRLDIKSVNSADFHGGNNDNGYSILFIMVHHLPSEKTNATIVIRKQKETRSRRCEYGSCLKMCSSLFICNVWPPFSVCCGTVALNYLSKHEAPRVFSSLSFITRQSQLHTASLLFQSTIHMHSEMGGGSERVENILSGGL